MSEMTNKQYNSISGMKKLFGFDYLRITLAVLVMLYHMYYTAGCDFGVVNPMVISASVYMAAFFMLSGFLAFYTGCNNEINYKNVSTYIKKRILTILPMAFLLSIIYYLFSGNEISSRDWYALFFNETLLNATVGVYSFDVGLWFLSVLLLWQIVTPYLVNIIKQMPKKDLTILTILLWIFIFICPFLIDGFGISVYDNWSFRGCEYILGMICCNVWQRLGEKVKTRKIDVALCVCILSVYIYML